METFENLLNNIGIGVVCTDREGRVQFWNHTMEEWTGLVPTVILDHSLLTCFPQLKSIVEQETLQHLCTTAASFKPPPLQAGHPHPSSQTVVTEFQANVRDIVRDLDFVPHSEQLHSGIELNPAKSEQVTLQPLSKLESSEYSESTASKHQAASKQPQVNSRNWYRIWTFQPRQQQLEQAHADFVAAVSHELRTPLTSIKGFVDTLLQCHGQLSLEQEQRFLKIVKSQADRLIHMVEDVLLVSHLQSGNLHSSVQQLALSESFHRVLSDFTSEQQERVKLSLLPGLPTVWADPDRLDQILRNLLNNALSFSDDDQPVLVEAALHAKDPNRVNITIQDFGCGMDEEQLNQLFQRFNQVQNPLTRGDRAGTGLGLYITKSLVESFGGNIKIESTVNQGTTCHVDLPSAPDIRWTPPQSFASNSEPVPEWANFLL